ncbi:MAG TPA: hypothetical protein VFE51_05030 [Verrucomicrobiae bacterium]|nr:hypothetical protein [Verrucomicrobiae bacterium]
MTKRNWIIVATWLLCLSAISAVLVQRKQLAALRASTAVVEPGPASLEKSSSAVYAGSLSPEESRELLQLRGEVTRLTARKRQLAGVAAESERLKAQLDANPNPDRSSGIALPVGYIRKANAQFLGYFTPENTVQSWLWALQHHDVPKLLQSLTPDEAVNVQGRMISKDDVEAFFKNTDSLPGLAIQGRKDLPDGSVELQLYLAPNLPPQPIRMQVVNGEWKMPFRF